MSLRYIEMAKKKGKRKNGQGNVSRISGHGLIGVSSSSNIGAFVLDTKDLDTDLIAGWTSMGAIFEQWRIKRISFKFVSNRPVNEAGTICMAVTDDPSESSPTDETGILSVRTSVCAFHGRDTTLHYTPLLKKFYFTHDQISSDDRLEMPGVFMFASSGFTSTVSPGRIFVKYTLEFKGFSNTQINTLFKGLSTERKDPVEKRVYGKEDEDLMSKIQKLIDQHASSKF